MKIKYLHKIQNSPAYSCI